MSDSNGLQKITRRNDGVYDWTCATSLDYIHAQLRTGFKVCAAIDLVLVAVAVVLYLSTRSVELLIIFAAIAAGFLALVVLIFGLSWLLYRNPHEHYELHEDCVMTGYGRSTSWFNFKGTKTLTIHRDYLELRGKVGYMRVYAPAEDFAFVRDFVQRRMPDGAEISFQ